MKTNKLVLTFLVSIAFIATSTFAAVTGAETWENSCAKEANNYGLKFRN